MSLPELLAEIKEGKKRVQARRLTLLSGLAGPELALFQSTWEALPAPQRRELVGRLEELSQDSPELVFDPLFQLALRDPDKAVRLTALDGLAESQERDTIKLILDLLTQDTDEEVRAAAAQALAPFALMAELGELPPGPAREVAEVLLAAVRNAREAPEVRRRALEAVAALDSAEVKSLIRRAYYEGEDKEKASAIHAMGRNLAPEWTPLLLEELESADPEFRYEAAAALGETGLEEAVQPLAQALDDEDLQVRLSAVHALGLIGSGESKAALRKALHHADESVQEAAGEALAELAFDQEPLSFSGSSASDEEA